MATSSENVINTSNSFFTIYTYICFLNTVQWFTTMSFVNSMSYQSDINLTAPVDQAFTLGDRSRQLPARNFATDVRRTSQMAESGIEKKLKNLFITPRAQTPAPTLAIHRNRLDTDDLVDWDSVLDKIPPQYTTIARSIFCWLLAAQRPLLMREIIELMAIENDQTISSDAVQERSSSLINRILAATAGTVTINKDQEISFVNGDIAIHILGRSTGYSITLAEAHEHIALLSLRYLLNGNLARDLSSDSTSPRTSAINYIVEHWIAHYQACEQYSRSISGFYDIFERQCQTNNFHTWKTAYAAMTSLPHNRIDTPLQLAVTFGFVEFLKLRVEETCDLDPRLFAEKALLQLSTTERCAELTNFKISSNVGFQQSRCRSARRRTANTHPIQRRRNRRKFLSTHLKD